ncbi:exportin-5-like isoform X2 [Xenopus laevis]|uniref:Exportin-5-like isoform X2 n=1 Tax=Xenopus laevis TaxID=8355 RepID=A0A8J1KS57_XENLA|nr:exportin-5-like isoform X2 [Xenopus laevis]
MAMLVQVSNEHLLQVLCDKLVRALTVIMEPESSQERRLEAHKFCEEFKEKSPLCVPCGLQLSNKSQSPFIRHFGLHILEHVIKFRWNVIHTDDKVFVKNSMMLLISYNVHPILEEKEHIKDVIARIVVEIIKREWPWKWPEMLLELAFVASFGDAQMELVMFIFLRLAEDLGPFETVPIGCQKDLHTALKSKMDNIFAFMVMVLQRCTQNYQDLTQGQFRVAAAALRALAGYIEWLPTKHITANKYNLLWMLCVLLNVPELQLEAAECLLLTVSKKELLEERIPLLILFRDDALRYILTAAQLADSDPLQEKNYTILKTICQILCQLGSHLCSLTPSNTFNGKIPENFDKYLEALMSLTRHPSLFLTSSAVVLWGNLFRHKVLSHNPHLRAAIPDLLRAAMVSIVKVGFPSMDNSPSCEYSRLDFINDTEFDNFFLSFRNQIGFVVRCMCRLDTKTLLHVAKEWMQYQLSAPLDPGPQINTPGEALCSPHSPSFLHWEAMSFFCSEVFAQLCCPLSAENFLHTEGISLLQQVVHYETKDPLIVSCVLKSMSSLLPFVDHAGRIMPLMLQKLLNAAGFPDKEDVTVPRTVSEKIHSRASTILKTLCIRYPDLVRPRFEILHARIKALLGRKQLLNPTERFALMEVLVLAGNHLKNYKRQRFILEELLRPAVSLLLSEEMQRLFSGPSELISFLTANKPGSQNKEEYYDHSHHSKLFYCINAFLAVMKQSRWPIKLKEARAGGFVKDCSPNGAVMFLNPCRGELLKVLDSLLALIRTMNSLYLPEFVTKMSEILDCSQPIMDECDMSVQQVTMLKKPEDFLNSLYQACCQMLGKYGPFLQHEFYSIPNLAPRLLNSALTNLDYVSDLSLRQIVDDLVMPLVYYCPPEKYQSLVCPILGPLLMCLYQRLSQKWLCINQRTSSSDNNLTEEDSESQDDLADHMVRLLTRTAVQLIYVCCFVTHKTYHSDADATVMPSVEQAGTDEEDKEIATQMDKVYQPLIKLTSLGEFLVKNEVSTALLIMSFSSLMWKDRDTCNKSANLLCWSLLNQMITISLSADAALCYFSSVLCGLQANGHFKSCLSPLLNLAFEVYRALRPKYPELHWLMEQVPEIQQNALTCFDEKILSPKQKTKKKNLRVQFRNLLTGCIANPLAERFHKVHIQHLPAGFKKTSGPVMEPDFVPCAVRAPSTSHAEKIKGGINL